MELGARLTKGGATFAVRAPKAAAVTLCLFDGEAERSVPMQRDGDNWIVDVAGLKGGTGYGYRAHGDWAPEQGHWFDPAKLLVDPYATAIDRPFCYDARLSQRGADTGSIVPRTLLEEPLPDVAHLPPVFTPGGLIYEINVRGFTMLHPLVPPAQQGTVGALAHPAIIAHLKKLRVSAVELMPIVAWIDERHLPPLGLSNAWGYNSVVPMALDPRLVPGGIVELRRVVSVLRKAGIGVILDLVFNHTGESDLEEPAPFRAAGGRGRLPLRSGAGAGAWARILAGCADLRGDCRRSVAGRSHHDCRALGYWARRLSAREIPGKLDRVERHVP
jgi:glycogen debranching enzyme